jgi:hypothetical protein
LHISEVLVADKNSLEALNNAQKQFTRMARRLLVQYLGPARDGLIAYIHRQSMNDLSFGQVLNRAVNCKFFVQVVDKQVKADVSPCTVSFTRVKGLKGGERLITSKRTINDLANDSHAIITLAAVKYAVEKPSTMEKKLSWIH